MEHGQVFEIQNVRRPDGDDWGFRLHHVSIPPSRGILDRCIEFPFFVNQLPKARHADDILILLNEPANVVIEAMRLGNSPEQDMRIEKAYLSYTNPEFPRPSRLATNRPL